MLKSSILKKVIAGVLVLATVCTFSMVSCFAQGDGQKQWAIAVREHEDGSGKWIVLITKYEDGSTHMTYISPAPGSNNAGDKSCDG